MILNCHDAIEGVGESVSAGRRAADLPYHVRDTLDVVGDRYSFTAISLRNLVAYGVTPGEVWEALHSKRRMVRHLDGKATVVFGITHTGRHLAVFVLESDHEDNDWDVDAAREQYADEQAIFDRYTGRQH